MTEVKVVDAKKSFFDKSLADLFNDAKNGVKKVAHEFTHTSPNDIRQEVKEGYKSFKEARANAGDLSQKDIERLADALAKKMMAQAE